MSQANPRSYRTSELIPVLKETLWLIQSGIVRTTTYTMQGKVTALGYWGKDNTVGHPLNTVETLQIECLTDVQVVPIFRDEWSLHLPAILHHSEQTTRLMSYVIQEHIAQRLVNVLGWLGSRFGVSVNSGLLIDLPLSHAALAELIGSTRVSVTRLLGKLAVEGAVFQHRKQRILLLKDLSSLDIVSITCPLNPHRKA